MDELQSLTDFYETWYIALLSDLLFVSYIH